MKSLKPQSSSQRWNRCILLKVLLVVSCLVTFKVSAFEPSVASYDQLLAEFGDPISSFVKGSRRILNYGDRIYWLEDNRVMRVSDRNNDLDDSVSGREVIVMNPAAIQRNLPLGIVSSQDCFIRGGLFRHLIHDRLDPSILSLSGVSAYTTQLKDDAKIRYVQKQIRKVYLSFDIWEGDGIANDAKLVLHTSGWWKMPTQQKNSPTIHVFALKPEIAEVLETVDNDGFHEDIIWGEQRMNWDSALANNRTNGVNFAYCDRLDSKDFRKNDPNGMTPNTQLVFDVGNLEAYQQKDGSVTLIITHSSESRLDIHSKDGKQISYLHPRLVFAESEPQVQL